MKRAAVGFLAKHPVDTYNSGMTEARWPQGGDKLLVASTWLYDAPVARDPGERFYRMPMGYKRAGDLLIEQAARDRVDRSNVIYPALFCYRQAVELFLKKLLTDFAPELLSDRARPLGHDLSKLWAAVMKLMRDRGHEDDNGLQAVAAIIAELHEADEGSDGFRYPTNTKNLPFKFGDRGIDLDQLRDVMEGVANFLECAHTALAHEDDVAAELARHFP
jgi:hypothetical protein